MAIVRGNVTYVAEMRNSYEFSAENHKGKDVVVYGWIVKCKGKVRYHMSALGDVD
jgi:hypothetical protein